MTAPIVELPYGHSPYRLQLPRSLDATVVRPPAKTPPQGTLEQFLETALQDPIAAPRLWSAVTPGARVVIAVSDATRSDPRDAMLRALLADLPDVELTIAIANGTHGISDLQRLDIGDDLWRRAQVVNHDAHDDRDLVTIGETRRGTPVRLHRCAVEADWIIATGRIKPHYFAGYGAGCKAIFPGLGGNREIRINHELKREPRARAGVVRDNPCREDLEEAVAMLPGKTFLLNVVMDAHEQVQSAVAGHMSQAFQRGASLCEPFFRVRAPRAPVVIVSDSLPLTGSLYQASKLVAAAAGLLEEHGTLIVVAQCPEGIGPVDTVNRAIYEPGLRPRLPRHHRIVLVSDLGREAVAPSYCEWAPSAEAILEDLCASSDSLTATVLPHAGSLIVEPPEPGVTP